MDNSEHPRIIVETERLLLRYQQAADIAPLVDLWADPAVTRYMGGPRERAWLRSEFKKVAHDPHAEAYDLWPVVEKATGQVVGHCGLLEKEVAGKAEIELTYVLAASAWGKGYATEVGRALVSYAFEVRGLSRLIALIEPENVASARVAEKIGLRWVQDIIRPGGEMRQVYAIEREGYHAKV
jgi:[ribosomal protein S5]-alanine N-acetyltransferase